MRAVILHAIKLLSILAGFSIWSVQIIMAVEPSYVRESIRARGMGNAFTAVANDEMVFFYNPAGLRSIRYNIYEVFGFNFTINQNTLDLSNSSNSAASLGDIAGRKIYFDTNLGVFSHVNSRFGWSIFSGGLLDFQVRNPVFPYLETEAYTQGGIAGGIAWSFFDYQLDFGLGAKIVQRAGIDTKQHIFDEAIVEVTEDQKTTKLQNKFSNKAAFVPDAGLIYHFDSIRNMEPKVAVSIQNIGGLDFEGAGTVPMTMNIGVSTESELRGFDFILAADYRDLTNSHNLVSVGSYLTTRNLKIGAEMGLNRLFNGHHLLSIRLGRNGPYNSVGWSMNLFGFKIDYAKYSQEIGGYAGELEDKRTSMQVSLIF